PATIRGMKDAFARPDEAGRIMNKYHPAIDVAVAEGETKAVAELAQVKGRELGLLDPARVDETINVVHSMFKLKGHAASDPAQVKRRELGLLDPARVDETINVVNSIFKLKAPVALNDVYVPGFVS